jgi:hypothetical protein
MQSGQRHVSDGSWVRVAVATTLSLALSGATPAQAADNPPDLARLLLRSGSYVRAFQRSFAEVLSTERYQQTVRRTGVRTPRMRQIESEMFFAAIGPGEASMTIRNVTRVDGRRVPDSHDRVMRVLSSRQADRTESLRALAIEGARFNIGNVRRTFNDPTLALMFFAPAMQSRFQFVTDGSERIDSVLTYRVRFSETVRPSIIRDDRDDLDAAVSGVAHLTEDGRIVRTELTVTIGTITSARIRVRYHRDDNVEMLVPVSMDEDYRNDDGPGKGVSLISCTATYSDYQRFQTSIRILPR